MTNVRSRKAFRNQLNQLKKEISNLEHQIIELEINLYQYNKILSYHDRFKEKGFRKITKEQLRRKVDQFRQSKFQLLERLLETRQELDSVRQAGISPA